MGGSQQMIWREGEGRLFIKYSTLPNSYDNEYSIFDTDYESYAVMWSCSGIGPVHILIILAVGVGAVENDQWDPIRDQLQDFKDKTMGPVGVLTTNNGAPVSLAEATSSLNSRLINHEHLMDGFTSLVREVIPERIAHAKGTGAFGYFEVTHDISHIYAGIKNLGVEEARNVSSDLDYLIKDFYGAIAKGDFPSWTVSAQILTKSDVDKMGPRAFDITRLVSLKKFPLHPFGKITLNRNAKNYFAEIEQLAFSPSNLVPGVQGAPDKVFEARRLAYRDAQLFRLGGNFKKIPVNCPYQTRTFTYNRDGRAPVGNNGEDAPNYYPNSFNGPAPSMAKPSSRLIDIVESNGVDNFDQAADFYANEIPPAERDRLIGNLALWIKPAVKDIQKKMLELFTTIHPDLGKRVEQSLNASMSN
nr:catalase-like [Maniola hyperantus]